jgi:anti-sigma regulatory factor (Ser/Thr protein kinase)
VATRSLTVPSGPEASFIARRFLREVIHEKLPSEITDPVLLLTSEVVTNSTRHSGAPLGAEIEIIVVTAEARVEVTVVDQGKGFDPDRSRSLGDEGGWGWHLIRTLASRWGVERRGPKTAVWFEIETSSKGPRPKGVQSQEE